MNDYNAVVLSWEALQMNLIWFNSEFIHEKMHAHMYTQSQKHMCKERISACLRFEAVMPECY